MKKLIIATAVAGGAAVALLHCRDMLHDHLRGLPAGHRPDQGRGDGTE
jgi:hypothetical protein